MDACFLLLRLISFFSVKPRDWLGKRLQNDLFCVGWDVKPQLSQSFKLEMRKQVCLNRHSMDDSVLCKATVDVRLHPQYSAASW